MRRVLLLLLLFGCAPVRHPAGSPEPELPRASEAVLPRALTEQGLDQLLHAPSDRVRVVNLWASWCAPCRAELPMFGALAQAHPDIDVVLVSVDDAPDAGAAARLAAPTGLRCFLLGPDPAAILDRVVARWPRMIPVTLVIDAAGTEVSRWEGSTDRAALAAALGL